jgi:hypothetical protein
VAHIRLGYVVMFQGSQVLVIAIGADRVTDLPHYRISDADVCPRCVKPREIQPKAQRL